MFCEKRSVRSRVISVFLHPGRPFLTKKKFEIRPFMCTSCIIRVHDLARHVGFAIVEVYTDDEKKEA